MSPILLNNSWSQLISSLLRLPRAVLRLTPISIAFMSVLLAVGWHLLIVVLIQFLAPEATADKLIMIGLSGIKIPVMISPAAFFFDSIGWIAIWLLGGSAIGHYCYQFHCDGNRLHLVPLVSWLKDQWLTLLFPIIGLTIITGVFSTLLAGLGMLIKLPWIGVFLLIVLFPLLLIFSLVFIHTLLAFVTYLLMASGLVAFIEGDGISRIIQCYGLVFSQPLKLLLISAWNVAQALFSGLLMAIALGIAFWGANLILGLPWIWGSLLSQVMPWGVPFGLDLGEYPFMELPSYLFWYIQFSRFTLLIGPISYGISCFAGGQVFVFALLKELGQNLSVLPVQEKWTDD